MTQEKKIHENRYKLLNWRALLGLCKFKLSVEALHILVYGSDSLTLRQKDKK